MLLLRVVSRLLCYPDAELHAALPEIRQALAAAPGMLPEPQRMALDGFIAELAVTDLFELQENYVRLFDQGRSLSLHLFEHVHGESRDRGQAMVDLLQRYQERGFTLAARELPDYLPLLLEYLSGQEPAEVAELLGDAADVIVLLGARLRERGSPYGVLFEALETIAGTPLDANELRRKVAGEGPDPTLTRMDEIWEEEQVTFLAGNGADGCAAAAARPAAATVRWVDQQQPTGSGI
ncbi:MAG: nitrate reductase molybdenum cofactor assembly chaperone [Gammaproteobacteria bacterium]|nr:nitrate reductase molybdenum cofactor assembly chaperone [Gammaproteobacteria bacterium]